MLNTRKKIVAIEYNDCISLLSAVMYETCVIFRMNRYTPANVMHIKNRKITYPARSSTKNSDKTRVLQW